MRKKIDITRVYIGFAILFFLLICFFVMAINLVSGDRRVLAATIITAVLAFLIGMAFVLCVRNYVHSFGTTFSIYLDKMINGSCVEVIDTEDDYLDAKLLHKLQRLSEIIEANNKSVEEDKRKIQEVITDISHQVKTPLANLKMYNSTILLRKLPEEKEPEFREAMENQINKLDFLFDSMVKMSRLEAGMVSIATKATPVYDTILLALDGVLLHAEEKNIDISVSCDPDICVYHDKKWTAEAFFNILDNAVKYSKRNGKISIDVNRWELITKIDITDTGKGIEERHLAQVFKRFYREPDVCDVEGVGVGLFLTREIIAKQGGTIQAKSVVGKGSTFTICLLNDRRIVI